MLSALLGSLAMTMVWGRKPVSWFPSCVWGLWGVGWWFDNWIVDASIHLPVRGGCVSVAIPWSLLFLWGWWGVACFSVIICDNTCSVVWG